MNCHEGGLYRILSLLPLYSWTTMSWRILAALGSSLILKQTDLESMIEVLRYKSPLMASLTDTALIVSAAADMTVPHWICVFASAAIFRLCFSLSWLVWKKFGCLERFDCSRGKLQFDLFVFSWVSFVCSAEIHIAVSCLQFSTCAGQVLIWISCLAFFQGGELLLNSEFHSCPGQSNSESLPWLLKGPNKSWAMSWRQCSCIERWGAKIGSEWKGTWCSNVAWHDWVWVRMIKYDYPLVN